ncbi:MAG TPA: amidase [Thermoanaerobaculia bacterium]|jgi:amidase|nr:amidase [Thermoanaerobaculia bacterium]
MSDGPCELTARVLAGRLRRRQLTAVEVLEAHLERIEERNPALHAVVSLDAGRARNLAEAADAALRREEVQGPLHGVPMTLKDAHDVAGLRTTVGTAALDRVADTDGTVAARLRAAGAIVIGHTNVAAWLADPLQTTNPVFGRTCNPWDLERTPGGSSGGAAAALAAGMTPLEVASDLAGSIRLPAHFCGVYGLKTTEHRVPFTGFFRQPDGVPRSVRILSVLGPMARDLGDLELTLRILAGPDGQDGDVPPVPLGPRRRLRLQDLRLAVAPVLPGDKVAKSVRQQVERVAAQASDAGARVDERLPEIDWDDLYKLFGDLVTTITSLFSPGAHLRDEQRTLSWYFAALERRDRLSAAWQKYFADLDGLLLAPAPRSAFAHCEPGTPIAVDGETVSYWELGRAQTICNVAGLPGLAVPAGRDDDGLPIGLQIVGPLWSEMRLLEIARELERAEILPGFQAPPG